MRTIPNIESYELFSLIIEKTSHILRTPLGVSRAILKDASNGETLEQIDFQDALNANEKILYCLNFLKKVAPQFKEELKSFDLESLIPVSFQDRCKCESIDELNIFEPKVSQTIHCLLIYFDELWSRDNEFRIFYERDTNLVGVEISASQSIANYFAEDFFKQIYSDGRLESLSFLVAMFLSNSISYKLLEDRKCVFFISL